MSENSVDCPLICLAVLPFLQHLQNKTRQKLQHTKSTEKYRKVHQNTEKYTLNREKRPKRYKFGAKTAQNAQGKVRTSTNQQGADTRRHKMHTLDLLLLTFWQKKLPKWQKATRTPHAVHLILAPLEDFGESVCRLRSAARVLLTNGPQSVIGPFFVCVVSRFRLHKRVL